MLRAVILMLPFALTGNLGADPLTYENLPLGKLETPLILRTYLPDPGLDAAVFVHHGKGGPSPRYAVNSGQDQKGEFQPVKGIPAAVAVNHGPALSFAFDTTECRMLFAWQGGFLDMFPYWGDPANGSRRSFDYVPRLTGTVFTMAAGSHPLTVDGKPAGDPHYVGYDLDPKGSPTFHFDVAGKRISQRIEPVTSAALSCRMTISAGPGVKLEYRAGEGEAVEKTDTGLIITVTGRELSKHKGFERNLKITKVSAAAGSDVFLSYGCIACHSTDGSLGHGPSLRNAFGTMREIEGLDKPIEADDAYLRESIMMPNAKTLKGFPPNYMPPYPLKEKELESVILYIKSLTGE